MTDYETRIIKIVVVPKGDPIYSERATQIKIEDEASGEFVKVTQEGANTDYAKSICIDTEKWVAIREAIDVMISKCRSSHPVESDGLDNPNSLKSKELARIESSADVRQYRNEIADYYEKLR